MDRRTKARELAMQALYELDIQGPDAFKTLGDLLREFEDDELTRRTAWNWAKAAWENVKACDELIESCTKKWGLSRLCPVDRSILRLSVYQLKYITELPPKVVINEAIELAKKFSTDKSSGFVNGVLDAIMKKLQLPDKIEDDKISADAQSDK